MGHTSQRPPFVGLYLPLSHAWQDVEALTLLNPARHVKHDVVGGVVPLVPSTHAVKGAQSWQSQFGSSTLEQMRDPTGTMTEALPPLATMAPLGTGLQFGFPGSDCRYPWGHC